MGGVTVKPSKPGAVKAGESWWNATTNDGDQVEQAHAYVDAVLDTPAAIPIIGKPYSSDDAKKPIHDAIDRNADYAQGGRIEREVEKATSESADNSDNEKPYGYSYDPNKPQSIDEAAARVPASQVEAEYPPTNRKIDDIDAVQREIEQIHQDYPDLSVRDPEYWNKVNKIYDKYDKSDYKNRLDYDLRQEAYRLEKDGYNPEYDLLKQQAEREAYKPSDAAVEAYRQEMLKINQQHYDTPQEHENAMREAFGKYRDGKFEPSANDGSNSQNNTPNADNQPKDTPKYDDSHKQDNYKPTDNPPQDTPKGDDGNKLNMDTPNLDNQPKDTPKGDDDGQSGWEQFWDNPVDFLKKQWDKLTGKDKDDKQPDNQSAKDTPNTDNKDSQPQDGKDTPNEKPAETPDNNGEQNGGDDNGAGTGTGGDDNGGAGAGTGGGGSGSGAGAGGGTGGGAGSGSGAGSGGGVAVPGAGSGFGAGLDGGPGAGTMGAGTPNAPYYDPLLIALNTGNQDSKISVTSYTEENGGKMLDLNEDGIANNVSWIGKDTGILFYDANNNNQMDGVSELFTDGKTLDNGEISENGFDYVLKFLDTNGDNVLDEKDENFNQVKVLSLDEDNNEVVQTLEELEIKSLDLNYNEVSLETQHTYNQVKGESIVTQSSLYTKEDGTQGRLADVNFSYDTVNTKYVDNIELSAEQEKVANLKGLGFLRDLNQSATQSEDLNQKLAEYSQLETKEQQMEYLDTLAKSWAETSPYYSNETADIEGKEFYRNEAVRNTTKGKANQMQKELEDLDNNLNRFEKAAFETDATQDKLHILQQFYGQSDNTIYLEKPSDLGNVIDNIDTDYNNLKQDMYENLLFQTRLNPYLQEIRVNENNEFDFGGVENKFAQVYEENPEKALVDLSEFLYYSNMGELDPNLNQMFAKYYTQVENADELVDKEIAKQIIFPDENNSTENADDEINSHEIEILNSKMTVDDFAHNETPENEIHQDFNDELAYAEYMPDPRYTEQEDKEPDDDWLF